MHHLIAIIEAAIKLFLTVGEPLKHAVYWCVVFDLEDGIVHWHSSAQWGAGGMGKAIACLLCVHTVLHSCVHTPTCEERAGLGGLPGEHARGLPSWPEDVKVES